MNLKKVLFRHDVKVPILTTNSSKLQQQFRNVGSHAHIKNENTHHTIKQRNLNIQMQNVISIAYGVCQIIS